MRLSEEKIEAQAEEVFVPKADLQRESITPLRRHILWLFVAGPEGDF